MVCNNTILASIIIPCYNVAPYCEQALDSIIANDFTSYEIIAVDDGSSDGTGDLLERKSRANSRLHVVHQANAGVSAARNVGLDLARGKYIFFVDPDDTVASDLLSTVVSRMESGDADWCIFGFQETRVGADGYSGKKNFPLRQYDCSSNMQVASTLLPHMMGISLRDIQCWNNSNSNECLYRQEWGSVWRFAYRRDVIESYRLRFDVSMALQEDTIFNCFYAGCAQKLITVNKILYFYTIRSSGALLQQSEDARSIDNKIKMIKGRDCVSDFVSRHTGISVDAIHSWYLGTTVFFLLEIIEAMQRCGISLVEGYRLAQKYYNNPTCLWALKHFPVSSRHLLILIEVSLFRMRILLPFAYAFTRVAKQLLRLCSR